MQLIDTILVNQVKPIREQILSSITETKKALYANIGENTRNYLELYLDYLENEIKKLGVN